MAQSGSSAWAARNARTASAWLNPSVSPMPCAKYGRAASFTVASITPEAAPRISGGGTAAASGVAA